MTKRETLPDLWWVGKRRDRPDWMPHAYVCPLLVTLSMWLYRLRGKNARWYAGRRGEAPAGPPYDTEWISSARMCIGNWEARILFPRWMILVECHYRNWGLSRRFWHEATRGTFRLWSKRYCR